MDIFLRQQVEERLIQLPANSTASRVRAARDAYLDCRLVGFLGSETPGAGVAQYLGLEILSYEQAVATAIRVLVKPGHALFRCVRLHNEGDVRVEEIVILDLGQAPQISQLGRSNCDTGHGIQDSSVCFFSLRDSASKPMLCMRFCKVTMPTSRS